jgi:hypothetical protein
MRISQSFSEAEVTALAALCRAGLTDLGLGRSSTFRSLHRKVQGMEKRVQAFTAEQRALLREADKARKRERRTRLAAV